MCRAAVTNQVSQSCDLVRVGVTAWCRQGRNIGNTVDMLEEECLDVLRSGPETMFVECWMHCHVLRFVADADPEGIRGVTRPCLSFGDIASAIQDCRSGNLLWMRRRSTLGEQCEESVGVGRVHDASMCTVRRGDDGTNLWVEWHGVSQMNGCVGMRQGNGAGGAHGEIGKMRNDGFGTDGS